MASSYTPDLDIRCQETYAIEQFCKKQKLKMNEFELYIQEKIEEFIKSQYNDVCTEKCKLDYYTFINALNRYMDNNIQLEIEHSLTDNQLSALRKIKKFIAKTDQERIKYDDMLIQQTKKYVDNNYANIHLRLTKTQNELQKVIDKSKKNKSDVYYMDTQNCA